MTLRLTGWLFLAFVATMPLVRPFTLSLAGFRFPVWDLLFILIAGSFVLAVLKRQIGLKRHILFVFIGLYAVTLGISSLFSVNGPRSAVKLAAEFYLFGLAFIAYHLASQPGFLPRVTKWWLAGTAIALVGTLSGVLLFYAGYKTPETNFFLSHFGSLPSGNYPRVHSFFANANMYCNYLNVSLMIALGAWRAGWIERRRGIIMIGGIWAAALLTLSPGVGGLALVTGIWLTISGIPSRSLIRKLAPIPLFAAAAFFVAAAVVSADTVNTERDFRIPFAGITLEPSVRVLVWANVIESSLENPWTGRGVGIDPARVEYTTLAGKTQILADAHNVWLSVFGQAGLIGLGAMVALTVLLLVFSVRILNVPSHYPPIAAALACAVIGAFVYQGITGSFEDARHIWILFGLLCAAGSISVSDSEPASPML